MPDNISIDGQFFIDIYENEQLVSHTEAGNLVLKPGIEYLLNGGSIGSFNLIKVGSDLTPTDYIQTDLNANLPNNTGTFFSNTTGLTPYQYGFVNYFPLGYATGEWQEIGVVSGDLLFNRAIISGTPLVKGALQTAFAGIIFTVGRVT